jgi:predicted CoA-binding protein
VYPVNPNESIIEGLPVINNVSELPNEVKSISIITPPFITEQIVEAAVQKEISSIWMQPGAESKAAIQRCFDNQIHVIAGGPCILMILGFSN